MSVTETFQFYIRYLSKSTLVYFFFKFFEFIFASEELWTSDV